MKSPDPDSLDRENSVFREDVLRFLEKLFNFGDSIDRYVTLKSLEWLDGNYILTLDVDLASRDYDQFLGIFGILRKLGLDRSGATSVLGEDYFTIQWRDLVLQVPANRVEHDVLVPTDVAVREMLASQPGVSDSCDEKIDGILQSIIAAVAETEAFFKSMSDQG